MVDAENNKDQAETEIRTTMKAINVLGSRLQALHEKKEEVQRSKAASETELFQGVKSFMAAAEKLKSLRSSERKENQEALDETTRSVEQYVEQHKQNEEAVKNATRVEKELEEKRIALDDAISSLTKMLKLAKEDLSRTTQFLAESKDEVEDAKQSVLRSKAEVERLLLEAKEVERVRKLELARSVDEDDIDSDIFESSGTTGATGTTPLRLARLLQARLAPLLPLDSQVRLAPPVEAVPQPFQLDPKTYLATKFYLAQQLVKSMLSHTLRLS